MAKTITVSIENLLWYIKWNRIWHINTLKDNNYLSYYKGNWYWHQYRQPVQQNNNSQQDNDTIVSDDVEENDSL